MMPDNDKHSPGDDFYPPAAETWNNMVDAGEEFARRRLGHPDGTKTNQRDTDVIKVRNDTGSDRKRGEVVCFDGSPIDDGEVTPEHIWLKGVEVACNLPFGVYRYDTSANDIGKCQTSGVCIARVNVSDAAHKAAKLPAAGSYVLESAVAGPIKIVWSPGTGTSDCVVNIHGDQQKAKEIKFSYTVGGSNNIVSPTAFYSGTDPAACGPVEVEYPLGEPCTDTPMIAFLDENTGKYQADRTPNAIQGVPVTKVVVLDDGLEFVEPCTLNYNKQAIKVITCDEEPEADSAVIPTEIVQVMVDLTYGDNVEIKHFKEVYVCGFSAETTVEIPGADCTCGTVDWSWLFSTQTWIQEANNCNPGCVPVEPPPPVNFDQPESNGTLATTDCIEEV